MGVTGLTGWQVRRARDDGRRAGYGRSREGNRGLDRHALLNLSQWWNGMGVLTSFVVVRVVGIMVGLVGVGSSSRSESKERECRVGDHDEESRGRTGRMADLCLV